MYTMSTDDFKTNITAAEAAAVLDRETRGKVFEDGHYKYRIFVSFADGMSSATNSTLASGVILTILNEPSYIDKDLLDYAITRIKIMLRNYKEPVKVLVNKIWIDSYGHEINFANLTNASKTIISFDNVAAGLQGIKRFDLDAFIAGNERKFNKLERYTDYFNKVNQEMTISLDLDGPVFKNMEDDETRNGYFGEMRRLIRVAGASRVNKIPPLTYTVRCYPDKAVHFKANELSAKYNIRIYLFMDGEHPVSKGRVVSDSDNDLGPREKNLFMGLGSVLINAMSKPIIDFFEQSPVDLRKIIVSLTVDGQPTSIGNWGTSTYVMDED